MRRSPLCGLFRAMPTTCPRNREIIVTTTRRERPGEVAVVLGFGGTMCARWGHVLAGGRCGGTGGALLWLELATREMRVGSGQPDGQLAPSLCEF